MPNPSRYSAVSTRALDLREFLVGQFDLVREIVTTGDKPYHLDGEELISVVTATELSYEEHGVLVAGEHSFEVSRAYRYFLTGPTSATIHFADGTYFHDLDLATGKCRAVHYCDEDVYEGLIVVSGRDLLVRWSCRGPNKHYVATSRLRRRETSVSAVPTPFDL